MNMRKIAITIILSLATAASYAQTAYDALMFSENNYEGTARTVSMNNAFTALGGDLGSVTINPAASAVSGYSQLTITPSLTFSASRAQGVSPYTDGSLPYFQREMRSRATNFGVPNLGMTFSWETGRKRGLKSMSFGFVSNQTNSWNDDVYAAGTNSTTSYMGALATEATLNGYNAADLNSTNAYEYMPWSMVSAYQSGMISTFGGYDDQYVGASEIIYKNSATGETEIVLGGPLEQRYGHTVEGSKQEYIFNWGGNISDFIYFGVNFGINSITYNYDTYFIEKAVNESDFEIGLDNGETMYFQMMKASQTYRADGAGVFGKFGVIVTPGFGLRLGAAIQTPTSTTMTETWTNDADTWFSTGNYNSYSPYVEAQYTFISPMRANFGAAYTLGQLGLISIDYEVVDYSTMRYDTNNSDRQYFEDVNADIRERFGTSNMLRAGLEVKPIPELAVRAGYGYTSSAEKMDENGNRLEDLKTYTASFGLGYSSKNSFFADFAVQTRFLHDEYFMPYSDYIFDENGYVAEPVPQIVNRRSLWKALITFGWRF
jgi:hypothetical protein